MVEPTVEIIKDSFDLLVVELIQNEKKRLARIWEICQKRLPFGDEKERLDWFCLAMGMPLAKEKERFP